MSRTSDGPYDEDTLDGCKSRCVSSNCSAFAFKSSANRCYTYKNGVYTQVEPSGAGYDCYAKSSVCVCVCARARTRVHARMLQELLRGRSSARTHARTHARTCMHPHTHAFFWQIHSSKRYHPVHVPRLARHQSIVQKCAPRLPLHWDYQTRPYQQQPENQGPKAAIGWVVVVGMAKSCGCPQAMWAMVTMQLAVQPGSQSAQPQV